MFVLSNLTIGFPLPHYLHIHLFMMEFIYNPSVFGPNEYLVLDFALYMNSSDFSFSFSSPTLKLQLLKFPFLFYFRVVFYFQCHILLLIAVTECPLQILDLLLRKVMVLPFMLNILRTQRALLYYAS